MIEDSIELARLRALDSQAIAAAHAVFFPRLYRYAAYRVGDPALAEDIAAETLVRLLEALRKGSGPASNLAGWLHRTAHHIIADHYRRNQRRPTQTLEEDRLASADDPEMDVRLMEQREALQLALRKLTASQQDVLALRFGTGLSIQETAQAMGKDLNAIKALQFRALRALKRSLEGFTE